MSAPLDLEPVARGGFGLCEAPRMDADGAVWFSDAIGGGVFRVAPDAASIEEVVPRRKGVGGLVLHRDGGIVITGRDVVHVRPGGEDRVLFSAKDDSGIVGFNDLTTDSQSRLLVGALKFHPGRGETPVPGLVVCIARQWVAVAIDHGLDWPNGIGLAPDGTTAYVADYAHGRVVAADVDRQGALAENVRPFADVPHGSADGLAVDAEGGVWVALGEGGGLARLAPDGTVADLWEGIAPFVSSVSFGGADARDLVVTTAGGDDGGAVLRGRAPVAGARVVPAAV